MSTPENTIYYSDYLTEVESEMLSRIEQAKEDGRDILFVAECGAGKTTASVNIAKTLIAKGKETGIVVPLQAIVKSKEGSDSEVDFGHGKYFEMANALRDNAYFTVYNTFSNSNKTNTTEYLFCDEPQTLIQQANIRGVVNTKIITSKATKIYLTGTPYMLPQALDCDVVYMEKRVPSKLKRIVKYYSSDDNDASIILKIAEHNKGKCTKVIRVNDIKVITKMAGQLKQMGHSVATYYSADSEEAYRLENEDYIHNNSYDTLRRGVFNDVDFVLCTSALDSGVDLVCNRELFLYCIGRSDYERKTRLMPHPVDVKQFSARPRKQKVVKVYCIGKFAGLQNYTSDYWLGQEAIIDMFKEISIDELDYLQKLNKTYQNAEYNSESTWVEMLTSFGMIVEPKGFLDTIGGIKINLRYDLEVIKHVCKAKQYEDIDKSRAYTISAPSGFTTNHTYHLGINLESISNTNTVIYKESDYVQIEALATHIRKASELGIDISPFLTEREFRTGKLKEIIDCLSYINTSMALGSAIRDMITEGSISKNDLRLLEGEGEKLETFLKTYFNVNRKAFRDDRLKNIHVKGLKNSKIVPPMALIEHLEHVKSEWLNPLIRKLEKINKKEDIVQTTNNGTQLSINII